MASQEKATDNSGKVGTSIEAAQAVGGKGDFGIPVHETIVRDREEAIENRPAGTAPGYSGDRGARTTGVGSRGGAPGHNSGGDIDTDFIGLDGHGGLAANPVSSRRGGADQAGDPSDTFASGKHAAGKNNLKPGTHGVAPGFRGDVVDHSGEDASTNSPNSGGTTAAQSGTETGAEGEIGIDEAEGDVDQGAEL